MGTLAEWVAAVAAAAGTILSIFALKFSLAANRTAERARDDANAAAAATAAREVERANDDRKRAEREHQRELERDARDRARERRELAGSVAAWWVGDRDEDQDGNRRYGVVISNQSTVNAVFHDVDVHVSTTRGGTYVIHMAVLPSGKFFVQQHADRWDGIPRPVGKTDVLDPFTVARDRSIDAIEYTDGLGGRWRWTATDGLTDLISRAS